LILVLVVVAAAAGGAAGFFGHDMLNPIGSGSAVPAAEVETSVKARGRLEPESELIAIGLPTGSQVERLFVKEGDHVRKDDLLAYLDSHGEMVAARDHAKVQLEEARKRLATEKDFGAASVESARLRKRQIEAVSPRTLEAQEAEVRRSQAELAKAELDFTRIKQMHDDRSVPKNQLDGAVLARQQAQEQLARNRATLAQLKTEYPIKLHLADADLKSAEVGSTRAQLAVQVNSLLEALKVADARLARSEIRAPVEGDILKIITRASEAGGRDPLLKMGDTSTMYAVAEVYETDVWRVQRGQKATVTSKAFPPDLGDPNGGRLKLTGTVERIASLVRKNNTLSIDPTEDADTRVVPVHIKLDKNFLAARYNQLQVDVTIDTGR
jgi:HlyD family secretion protein